MSDGARPEPMSDTEEHAGLSPNARLVYISPDQIGLWRLRKSLSLDDARWYFDRKRMVECRQIIGAARFSHREIMRIKRYLRTRETLPQQEVQFIPLPEYPAEPIEVAPALKVLTPRQREFLLLMALGKDRDDVAAEMGISEGTAQVYQSTTARKLGIKYGQLPAYAITQGWNAPAGEQ